MSSLAEIKGRVAGGEYKQDTGSVGAPFIAENTYVTFSQDMGINWVPGSSGNPPFRRGLQMVEEVFHHLARVPDQSDSTTPFFNHLGNFLRQSYPPHPNMGGFMDGAAVGMVLVIHAFRTELGTARGGEFLDNLRKVDSKKAQDAFEKVTVGAFDRMTLLGRVGNKIALPDDQVFLRRGIHEFITKHTPGPLEQSVEDGAHAMYAVIDTLWKDIRPREDQEVNEVKKKPPMHPELLWLFEKGRQGKS